MGVQWKSFHRLRGRGGRRRLLKRIGQLLRPLVRSALFIFPSLSQLSNLFGMGDAPHALHLVQRIKLSLLLRRER
jgi:hypothetical protein